VSTLVSMALFSDLSSDSTVPWRHTTSSTPTTTTSHISTGARCRRKRSPSSTAISTRWSPAPSVWPSRRAS